MATYNVSRHRKQKMAALVALEAELLRIVDASPPSGKSSGSGHDDLCPPCHTGGVWEAKPMITLQYLHDRLYNSIEAAVRDATATVVANIAYDYQRDTADEVIGPIVTNVLMELTKLPGENWLRDLYELDEG